MTMTTSHPATGRAPLSVLDLAPIREGGTVGEALRETLQLARTVEDLGYHRFWWPSTTTSRASPARRRPC